MNISGNTRVITQNALQTFQEEMAKVKKDPYKVIMRQTKLPITLLNETAKVWKDKAVHNHSKPYLNNKAKSVLMEIIQ